MPITAIQKMLNEEKYSGKLSLEYRFIIEDLGNNRKVELILEHPERYHIYVNDHEVNCETNEWWLDIRWKQIDISHLIKQGQNEIILTCDNFQYGDLANIDDHAARYGTEIEAIYIKGDFAVIGKLTEESFDPEYWEKTGLVPDLKFLDHNSIRITEPKPVALNQLVEVGLPFYAGRISYKTKLPSITSEKVNLAFETLNAACAEIYINDQYSGAIMSAPYSIDITKFYKSGATLEIILYSSLRNLLGPLHHTSGELALWVSPEDFEPQFDSKSPYAESLHQWMSNQITPNNWQDNYCLINFGNIGKVSLKS